MLLTRRDAGQGSFAPRRLNRRLDATMNPSDAANRPRRRLWLPAVGCPRWTPVRASQVPDGSIRARCLLSPREFDGCVWSGLPRRCRLHRIRQTGHSRFCVTRPNRVRGTLRLARWLSPASTGGIAPTRFGVGYMTFDLLSGWTRCSSQEPPSLLGAFRM